MSIFARAVRLFSRRRTLLSVVAATAVAGLLAIGLAEPAVASPSAGSYNVTIFNAEEDAGPNLPVDNAFLEIFHFNADENQWEYFNTSDDETNNSGQLDAPVTGLVPGDKYAVEVYVDGSSAPQDSRGWMMETGESMASDFSDTGDPNGDTVFVATSGETDKVAFLNPGVTVTGNIIQPLDDTAGVPTPSTDADYVALYRQSFDPVQGTFWEFYADDESLTVGTDSSYSVQGLSPGTYIAEADQQDQPTWAERAYDLAGSYFDNATPFTFTNFTDTPTQDIEFVDGGTISGEATADPAVDSGSDSVVRVKAYPLDSHNQPELSESDPFETDVDPTTHEYSLSVAPGEYEVQFDPINDISTGNYYSQWYNNSATSQYSTIVDVPSVGDTEFLADQVIGQGLTIFGHVVDIASEPLSGIVVDALPEDGSAPLSTTTDVNGDYSLTVPTDTYNLQFHDPSGFYPDRYLNGSNDGTSSLGSASTISQAGGTLRENFVYDAYSSLTVHVANKAGTSLTSVNVLAESMSDGAPTPNQIALEATPLAGHPGTYVLDGMQENQDYALYFDPRGSSLTGTYGQFYGGAQDAADSKLVNLNSTSSTLDVTLASAASLSGVVTNSSHAKLKGVEVGLFSFDGTSWNEVDDRVTTSTGAYSFLGLATGSYTVQFFAPFGSPYINGFAGGASDAQHATAAYVAPGKPAVLNATLATGGSISGVLGAPGGTPKLPAIYVTPVALTGVPGNFTAATPINTAGVFSSNSGKFSVKGLPTGYYALSFADYGDGVYGDSYVSPVGDPSSTTPIYHVTAGHAVVIPGVMSLPLLSDQATGLIVGGLDTSAAGRFDEAAGAVDFFDPNGNFVSQSAINTDGSFQASLIPSTDPYSYTAYIFDPLNPQDLFAMDNDTFLVSDGNNGLTIPVVPEVPLEFTNPPQITDTSNSAVGTLYTLNDPTWNHSGATVSYQWLRGSGSGAKPIYGATGSSYVSQPADDGQELQVRITVSDDVSDQFGPYDVDESLVDYETAADPVTDSGALTNTSPPTTTVEGSGEATIGQVIHAQPGDWNGIHGATYSYQWIDESTTDVLGTGPTFTPTLAEYNTGDPIRLFVSATAKGYTPASPVPDAGDFIVIPLATPVLKVAPKVTSKLVGGNTVYTVTPGTWSVAGTTPLYQWSENAVGPVSGATHNTFTYNPTTDGTTTDVTVTVAAVLAGHGLGQTTVVARKDTSPLSYGTLPGVLDSATGTNVPDVSSPVTFGSVLTAGTSTLGYSSDNTFATTFTYQWQRNTGAAWVNIAGATHQSYTVGAADIGDDLDVTIYGSSATHAPEPFDSFAGQGALRTDLVDTPATITPAASNTGDPLAKLVETVGAWGSTSSVTDSYQWYDCPNADDCSDFDHLTNFTAIPHATLSTYTPTDEQAADTVGLVVIGSKTGYESSTIRSAPVTVGNEGTILPATLPVISSGLSSGNAGNAVYATKLTAKAGTFDQPGVAITYNWQVSVDNSTWTNADGIRNGLTYTPSLPDMTGGNLHIRISETATKAGFNLDTSYSDSYPLVGAIPVPKVAPVVALLGPSPQQWFASSGTWPTQSGFSLLSGTVTYQWFADGIPQGSPSTSGNSFDPTLVLPSDSVSVKVTDPGDLAYQSASRTIVVQKGTAPSWLAPTVSGTPAYGNTLSAPTVVSDAYTYPDGSMPNAVLTYQWYEGSTAILHATGSSYTPPTTYIGKSISVKITTTSSLYATATNQTAGVPFTAGDAPHGTATLSYTGSLHSGSSVGIGLSGYPSGVAHTYKWQVSTDDSTWSTITGATKSTYVVPPAYLGEYLRAAVMTTKTGYGPATDYTPEQIVVAPTVLAPIVAPTLTGTCTLGGCAVGTVLTVSPGTWNVTGTTLSYQWFRDGIVIPGVTGTTYTPTGDELGELISVNVTAHAAGYDPAVATPNSVSVSAGAAPALITLPKITGTAASGSTLTVSTGVWGLDDLTVTYQWYSRNGGPAVMINGATQSTFTPDDSLIGSTLFVTVSVTRDGYDSHSVSTASTAAVGS